MRLWHYKLIPTLPQQQLVAQWRELVAIKRKIDKCGNPNHPLVNYVLKLSNKEWVEYCNLIYKEMLHRNYKPKQELLVELCNSNNFQGNKKLTDFHTELYYDICYYNLFEKCIRGIVSEEEWFNIPLREDLEILYGENNE